MDLKRRSFHERLSLACAEKRSYLCVGIDPRPAYLPGEWSPANPDDCTSMAEAFLGFSKEVVDLVSDQTPVIKPQSAFFEALGHAGVKALEDLTHHAHQRGLLVIGDLKRGDIGSTAAAYAQAAFREHRGQPLYDAVTVNPYLGVDGVAPFIEKAEQVGSGIFVLCKTSNPSSADLQDLSAQDGRLIYSHMASMITGWGQKTPGLVGAVVGATHPEELALLRGELPHAWILIPGLGAQGGRVADVLSGFSDSPQKSLLSASRSITFPWLAETQSAPENWRDMIKEAVAEMNAEIRKHLFQ